MHKGKPNEESAIMANLENRWCYYISPITADENDEFLCCIVEEDEPGYHVTDWHYGKSLKFAEEVVQKMNKEKLGLTPMDVSNIIASSMRVSNIK